MHITQGGTVTFEGTVTFDGSVAVRMASETGDSDAAHPLIGPVAEGVRCAREAWSCVVE
jgi:hypothetical protein